MPEPERVAVAQPLRASLVLAHLLPLVAIVTVIGVLDGRASALQALPILGTLFGLVLLFNLWYWGWNRVDADEHGLIEVIRGRDRRTVAWDDILAASYLGGSFMWGMAGSISSGVHLETTLPTPERLFQYEGELTIGRLQPLFFWERGAVETEATEVLRRFLGNRVNDP
jgi:hypothetical protein